MQIVKNTTILFEPKKWLQICGIRKKAANKRACANLFATLLLLIDLNSQIYGCKLSAMITHPSPS